MRNGNILKLELTAQGEFSLDSLEDSPSIIDTEMKIYSISVIIDIDIQVQVPGNTISKVSI